MPEDDEKLGVLETLSLNLIDRTTEPLSSGAKHGRRKSIELMRPIERGVIIRGAIAGALSGLAAALGVAVADPLYVEEALSTHWSDNLAYYGVALGIAVIATIFEIAYLYVDGMKSAVALGRICGEIPGPDEAATQDLKLALIRAGLELPCRKTPLHDIDPLSTQDRLKMLLFAVVYKLKVSVTSLALKTLLKRLSARVGGRVLGRSAIELVAVPVFAAWNAIVCRQVMRQARVRALGRLLVEEVFELAFPAGVAALEVTVQQACFLAIHRQVTDATAFHYNLILLTRRFIDEASMPAQTGEAGPDALQAKLLTLSPEAQKSVLEFFALLCALDGKSTRRKARTLTALQGAAGLPPTPERVSIYLSGVLDGEPLSSLALDQLTFPTAKTQ